MSDRCRYTVAIAGAVGVAILTWSCASRAQAPSAQVILDNMKCIAAKPDLQTLRTGSDDAKRALLKFGLPCLETVDPAIPDPAKTSLENLQFGFDLYSWLTFLALNAPQIESERGRPDAKTRWEDPKNFIQLLDVMRTDVKNPSLERKIVPPNCLAAPGYKPGTMIVKMIEETYNQPFKTGPLIDQRRNYALFDILMNKQMFDYIVKHGLYSKEKQQALSDLKIDFPAGHITDTAHSSDDVGAVMIKVSWKILEDDDIKSKKFHMVDALVSMPKLPNDASEPPCLRKTLGLVGFHVAHKTVGRLQWIWTSFEHVDNVPEQDDVASGKLKKAYNFYDPSCDVAKCPVNEVPPQPWEPERAQQLKFHNPFNSQIVRVVALTDETKDLNRQFQALLRDSIWKNYMLLSTQWPSGFPCGKLTDPKEPAKDSPLAPNTDFDKQPDMTCAPAPTFLANSTLETYSQGTEPLASSSCMSCHANATSYQRIKDPKTQINQSDFTFMLEKAFSEKSK